MRCEPLTGARMLRACRGPTIAPPRRHGRGLLGAHHGGVGAGRGVLAPAARRQQEERHQCQPSRPGPPATAAHATDADVLLDQTEDDEQVARQLERLLHHSPAAADVAVERSPQRRLTEQLRVNALTVPAPDPARAASPR